MVVLIEEAKLIAGEISVVTFAFYFRVRDKRIFKNINDCLTDESVQHCVLDIFVLIFRILWHACEEWTEAGVGRDSRIPGRADRHPQ